MYSVKMDEEVAKKDATIDALSSALKREKDENKKLKEEKEKYVNNRDTYRKQAETQQHMQADIDKLRTELALASTTPKRCFCSKTNELESGSESLGTYTRRQELQIGSESLSSYASRIGASSTHAKESLAKRVPQHMFTTDQRGCSINRSEPPLCVVSIGFQTTYFTTAFSMKGSRFSMITPYLVIGNGRISQHLSSDVLLNEDEITVGYEAETKYNDLTSNNDQPKASYIRCMLRQLLKTAVDEGLNEYTNVEDASKKPVRALAVFSKCIKYLVDDVIENIHRDHAIAQEDIKWVFTVPSFWTNKIQQFISTASIQAGILSEQLSIVLEPQAAVLYCMNMPLKTLNRNTSDWEDMSTSQFSYGTKYMIVDFGGITTNISLHTLVYKDIRLECSWTSGVSACNIVYEEALKQLIVPITGKYVYEKFRKRHCLDYEDVISDFRGKFRDIGKHHKYRLFIPHTLIELCEKVKDMTFKDAVAVSNISVELLARNKLNIDETFIKGLFKDTLNNTVNLVREVLHDTASTDVDAVVFVGEFAGTKLLQEAVLKEFPEIRLIIPADPEFAVLQGAVLYGHMVV